MALRVVLSAMLSLNDYKTLLSASVVFERHSDSTRHNCMQLHLSVQYSDAPTRDVLVRNT